MDQDYKKEQLELQVRSADKMNQLMSSSDWDLLVGEMKKELERLTLLTEEADFVKQAGENVMVLADNLSFRRGIRYVIEYPGRLRRAGELASERLKERAGLEEATT